MRDKLSVVSMGVVMIILLMTVFILSNIQTALLIIFDFDMDAVSTYKSNAYLIFVSQLIINAILIYLMRVLWA